MDPSNWKISQHVVIVFPGFASEGHTVTPSSRLIVDHIVIHIAKSYREFPFYCDTGWCLVCSSEVYWFLGN